jgi:5-methylthioribose kinase
MSEKYLALTLADLPKRLSKITAITDQIGSNYLDWQVKEVGDGNLNLVFIVKGTMGTIVIKQALPYVRIVGDSWPLTLDRAFFEYNALIRQEQRDPGVVPSVFHFDKEQGLIAMECLNDHKILRGMLIEGTKVEGLANVIGKHCARLAFRGSDLHMETKNKKEDVCLFQKNVELIAITENLVFTDPYFRAEMNQHTESLSPTVKILREDVRMKSNVQHMLRKFTSNAETMCHGDLHSGSIMCTKNDTRVIDPEFAFYGPMGFDLGMNIANYLMAYFSQPAHRENQKDTTTFQNWILRIIEGTVDFFYEEFKKLWKNERNGILYPKCLFEDQGHASENALEGLLKDIWRDVLSVCGIEMHRRCLSLAHNADFETIEDTSLRAKLETRNLLMGRELILNFDSIKTVNELSIIAKNFNKQDIA